MCLDRGYPRDFKDCKDFKKVESFKLPEEVIMADLTEALNDLAQAKKSFEDLSFKWATSQAYYSMFLSARAALFSKGYRDKKHNSHLCLSHFLKRLVELGYLKSVYQNDFLVAMDLRERANYDAIYSREDAEKAIGYAGEFIHQMETIINTPTIKL